MSQRTCPCCGASDYRTFYKVAGVPTRTSDVYTSASAAVAVSKGDLELAACASCAFIGNVAFDPSILGPEGDYEDQQGFSPTFSAFARELAAGIIERYDLRDRRVVEVGCGKGDFLALLCEMGGNTGVGVDPLARADRLPRSTLDRVEIVPEYYGESHGRFEPDVVVCRHTLEHIADPAAFLRTLRRSLRARPGTPVVFEVPDATRILRDAAFWDVYYEHCSYFTPVSLERCFRRAGFDVTGLSSEYDGQYLVIHARTGSGGDADAKDARDVEAVVEASVRFGACAAHAVQTWRARFDAWKGSATTLWGSGSKCVAFVTTLGIASEVAGVVDVNPFRHGKYIPALGRPVMAPGALRELRPARVVIMNAVYRDEIAATLRADGVDAEIETV